MYSSLCNRLKTIFSKSPKHFSAAATTTTTTLSNVFTTKQPTPTSQIPPIPSEIEELVKKFKKNSRSTSFRTRLAHYDSVVRRLATLKHHSAIEDILEHQKKYKESMKDEGFGVRLITLYGKAGMFDHAYKVFDELPNFDCPRTVISFNALLSACVKSKNLDKVGEFFRELPEKLGVEPDVVSYNTVIRGFCESSDYDSALMVVEKMEESEVRPDVVSYNTIMEAFYKENKMDEAEKLWSRMVERGVIANARSYNSKLRCLVKNDQVQEALELVEKMVNEKVNPDKYTYNAVIKGCVSKGKLEEAKIFFSKMVGDGCRLPDHTTYEMLISFACEKDDIDFALALCKHSVELRVAIYRSLMQLVVDALIKRSMIEEANELVELVKASKKHRYTLKLPAAT